MIDTVEGFEEFLEATGKGAFGKIEYEGEGIVLRSSSLKTPDRGSIVRVYFDEERNQVMTGRRFELVRSQWLIRKGAIYRIYTNVRFVSSVPSHVSARVELTKDGKDVFGLMSFHLEVGEPIAYTVLALRSVEVEPMCSFASLVFEVPNPALYEVLSTGIIPAPEAIPADMGVVTTLSEDSESLPTGSGASIEESQIGESSVDTVEDPSEKKSSEKKTSSRSRKKRNLSELQDSAIIKIAQESGD